MARIQSAINSGGGINTCTATFPTATTAGNLLIAVVSSTNLLTSVSSGWTLAGYRANGTSDIVYLYYRTNSSSQTSFTANIGIRATLVVIIAEYSGYSTFDSAATNTGSVGLTTTGTNELLVAGFANNTSASYSSNNGFTLVNSASVFTALAGALFDYETTSSGSYSVSGNTDAIIASFTHSAGTTTASGVFPFYGTATVSKSQRITGSGTLPLTGSFSTVCSYAPPSNGLFPISGSATVSKSQRITGSGTLPLTGSFSTVCSYAPPSNGLFPISGSATVIVGEFGSGSFPLSGTAGVQGNYRGESSGTFPFSGSFTVFGNATETMSGAFPLNGSFGVLYLPLETCGACNSSSVTGTGNFILQGSASVRTSRIDGSGSLTIFGTAGVRNISDLWDGYRQVYWLDEDGDGTSGEYQDHSRNALDATGGSGAGISTPILTSGVSCLYAQDFNGLEWISNPDNNLSTTQSFSVSGWVQLQAFYQTRTLYQDRLIRVYHNHLGRLLATVTAQDATTISVMSTAATERDRWVHVGVSWVLGSGLTIYINGTENVTTQSSTAATLFQGSLPAKSFGEGFTGGLGDWRVSSDVRSQDWFRQEFLSSCKHSWTVGSEEYVMSSI